MKNKFIYYTQVISRLTSRNFKVFLKDKMLTFMSILAPIIILMLYVLFLGDMQKDSIVGSIPEGLISTKTVNALVDGWMLSGVLSVSCITVALSVSTIMVNDKEKGAMLDYIASPAPKSVIKASYIISTFCISAVICLIVEAIGFIYLAISGWYLSVSDVFAIIGVTLISVLSASLIMNIIASLFKTSSSIGAFSGILSAAIGFIMGAYMPLQMLGKGVEYLACFVPGTYSAGAMRDLFMGGPLDSMAESLPAEIIDFIAGEYSIKVNFFGCKISSGVSIAILAGTAVAAAIVILAAPIIIKKIKLIKSKKESK